MEVFPGMKVEVFLYLSAMNENLVKKNITNSKFNPLDFPSNLLQTTATILLVRFPQLNLFILSVKPLNLQNSVRKCLHCNVWFASSGGVPHAPTITNARIFPPLQRFTQELHTTFFRFCVGVLKVIKFEVGLRIHFLKKNKK
uniref:(northern house mosquito) hypothetical protein n=1 Tax=Culex pipiens TaxID=7175 RepID=A0A8D8HEQ9_CULPI